jgi:uncharacterized membrane protein (UPF0127 family)
MRRERLGRWTLLIPETRRERAVGLLGRSSLDGWTALVLARCRSVHTFGMLFPIDVVVIGRRGEPARVVTLRPGRIMPPALRVAHIVEVAAGRGDAFSAALAGSTTPAALDSGRPRRTAAGRRRRTARVPGRRRCGSRRPNG